MLTNWVFIGLFLLLAPIFPAAPIILQSILFGPKRNHPLKNSTYECGVEPRGAAWVQFKAQYYVFTLVFVVFDVETVFLFPFAAAYGQVALFAALEAALFIVILGGGLVYLWRKSLLEWI